MSESTPEPNEACSMNNEYFFAFVRRFPDTSSGVFCQGFFLVVAGIADPGVSRAPPGLSYPPREAGSLSFRGRVIPGFFAYPEGICRVCRAKTRQDAKTKIQGLTPTDRLSAVRLSSASGKNMKKNNIHHINGLVSSALVSCYVAHGPRCGR